MYVADDGDSQSIEFLWPGFYQQSLVANYQAIRLDQGRPDTAERNRKQEKYNEDPQPSPPNRSATVRFSSRNRPQHLRQEYQ